MKKIILNADDFGLSVYHNQAVLEGYKTGFLTSASLCANGTAFDDAVNNVKPKCKNLGIGAHLNIMEGKSLTDCFLLTDKNGYFNKSYAALILAQNDNKLLNQIENEFRAQIEKIIKSGIKIDHLDSHIHTHAIPEIFKITCSLAKEYNIGYVRTQSEKPYLVYPGFLSYKYLINLVKIALLGYYSNRNKKLLNKFNLKSNNFIIGIGYTGMMNSHTVLSGLSKIPKGNTTEVIIHPCKGDSLKNNLRFMEFALTQDMELKSELNNLGFVFTNYSSLLILS